MREGVAVNHKQRATQGRGLNNSRCTASPSRPIAGPMGRLLRFRQSRRLAASFSNRSAAAAWPAPKSYPYARMVTRAFHTAQVPVDAAVLQALRRHGTQ
jgi:hypothetical protein